jgi:hypothetical protein
MTTASDREPSGSEDGQRLPSRLEHPQPLGFLPTRQFWRDPDNQRLIGISHAICVGVLLLLVILVVDLLDLSWWVAGLATAGGLLLIQGLFERHIRRAGTDSMSSNNSRDDS